MLGTGDTEVNQMRFLTLRSGDRHTDSVINAGRVGSEGTVMAQRRHLSEPGAQGSLLGEADS